MKQYVLLHGGKLLFFLNLPVWAGITTTNFGSVLSGEPDFERKIDFLLAQYDAARFFHLAPNHGQNIFNSDYLEENPGQPVLSGDAVYTGNEKNGYIGLIHCSTKTTLEKNIISATIKQMAFYSPIKTQELNAFIYPGICQNCYEVRADVFEYANGNKSYKKFFQENSPSSWLLDLKGLIRQKLIESGIPEENISSTDTCSSCNSYSQLNQNNMFRNCDDPVFYSYRKRSDKKKRNIVFAKLPEDKTLLTGSTGDCPYVILWKNN